MDSAIHDQLCVDVLDMLFDQDNGVLVKDNQFNEISDIVLPKMVKWCIYKPAHFNLYLY